jgi:predicted nucleic acid-binding protein
MPDSERPTFVFDASVVAKVWFEEANSEAARDARVRARALAPDFLSIEMASIAAKCVRRGLATEEQAACAVREVKDFVDELAPSGSLIPRAYELARDHGLSVYDGLYLALAETSRSSVLSADVKLVQKVRAAGLGHLVRPLTE